MTAAPVLFVHFGDDQLRGSERVLLDLVAGVGPDYTPVVWCNSEVTAAAVAELGVEVHRSDMSVLLHYRKPQLDVGGYVRLVREGARLIDRYGIRLIHANSGAPVQWMAPVARARRIPLVAHLHAPYVDRDRTILLLDQASMVVGCSRAALQGFDRDGLAPESLKVVLNGVDTERLLQGEARGLRARLSIPDDAVVVATVAALTRAKGIDTLLQAGQILASSPGAPVVHYLVVGSGPYETELRALARQLHLEARVHFLGEQRQVGAILRDCADIFALPSRFEALGLVFAEAAVAGIPSVGTRVGGIPEVVRDGETGLLVPVDDPQRLADALHALATNRALRHRMGGAARQRALAEFTIHRVREEITSLYHDLLRRPSDQFGWGHSRPLLFPFLRLLGRRARRRLSSAVARTA